MMENQWLEIDNNNPFTLLEIEGLVTEETKHNQQQPKHLVWDWGAGGRGNKTPPTIGDWWAGDRGNKQPTTTNSNWWRLRSWWQRKQNTSNINQITMEVEELVTEKTKHIQHQPNHNGGWGAGDRGNKTQPSSTTSQWRLRSWWQRKQNTTNINQITMEVEELVTEETNNQQHPIHIPGLWGAGDRVKTPPTTTKSQTYEKQLPQTITIAQCWRLRSWSQRNKTTTKKQFTKMDIGELVTEGNNYHQQPFFTMLETEELVTEEHNHYQQKTIHNVGYWGAGDRGTQPIPTKINSQWWRLRSWGQRKKPPPTTNYITEKNTQPNQTHNQHQTNHTLRTLSNNSLNTNPNNGDWEAGDRGIISPKPTRMETIHNHGPTCIGCMPNNNDVEALCTPPTTNHS